MDKSPDAFRTISEVAEWLGVQAHVLRFWESKFTQVKPVKRAGGRRYYRPADMLLLGGIKKLLHDDGLTIKGVQKTLREQSVGHVSSLSQELGDETVAAVEQPLATPVEQAKVVPFKSVVSQSEAKPEISPEIAPQDAVPPAGDGAVVEPPAVQQDPEPPTPTPTPTEPTVAVEEKPVLPSFLHRPSAPKPGPTAPPAEPVAATKRPIVIDAPDPPDEQDLPFVRGPLSELAGLDQLSAAQIAEIAPLAKELQAWLSRSRGAGAG